MSQDFATPNPELAPGSRHAGFTVERAEQLPEISGCAYVLRHDATRARVMWLATADDNKAFSIAFKTPPANDTGVFHILEHSVLCGSDRFPVKEPFVHLLKSSMQTFLNALTFPDKTMYPVSSTNDRDLENLMDIYLDAVLHPAIYQRRRIFEQEGWHYELAGAVAEQGADAASDAAEVAEKNAAEQDGELTLNGVVYNEMKGALSSPEEILICGMMRALFGQTPYGWVSGGDPKAIPALTYEEFLDTHARHYQLANSYTILYGNLDIEEKLAFLGKRFDSARPTAGAPNELPLCAPRNGGLVRVPMDTTPDNACVGVAYVFATAGQRERVLAADVLVDALVGSNEAPLKRAILDADLGSDVQGYLYDGILQPCLIFELQGAKPGVAEQFEQLVEQTCAELVRCGLGADNLEASLAQAEFNLREGDFGYPDGVGLAIQAMNGWLYNDEDATSYLRYEDALGHARAGLASGYFERLLDEAICHNAHRCCVEVVPTPSEGATEEARRLAKVREGLSPDELAAIAKEAEALHAEQAAPDTPEALATLPHLSLQDIGDATPDPTTVQVDAPIPCYRHDIDTRRIDYAYWYFDLGRVAYDELPYVSVLANLLGKLDTARHSAYELDTLCEAKLGGLSFFTEVYSDDGDPLSARPKFVVGASSLSENARWLAELPREIWAETNLADTRRIRDILEQRRVGMEQTFVDSGHAAALARVGAQFRAASEVSDTLGGVEFYRFLRDLLDHFDERADALVVKLDELRHRIFSAGNCEMSFTGPEADLATYWDNASDLGLFVASENAPQLVVPTPQVRAEAFIVPANVCFVGEGMDGLAAGTKLTGAWRVASQALSYDYLWNEVRVLGGAYGCGFRCTADSLLQFYSYRDPAVDPTAARFERASEWLASWDPTPAELTGFIVAGVAGMDAPVKPRALGRRLDATRLSGRGSEWRAEIRSQMLATTVDDVRALASPLAKLEGARGMCVFGGRAQIEASGLGLDACELFER